MGDEDDQPHQHRGEGGQSSEQEQGLVGIEVVEDDARQQSDDHRDHGHHRHAAARSAGEGSRGLALFGQSVEHPPRPEDIGIDGRQRRGDEDDLEDGGRCGEADGVEDRDEGADLGGDPIPGQDAHDHAEGEHIEEEDAHRHRVDGGRQHLLRVLRLAGGDSDDLDAAEGEHHDGER